MLLDELLERRLLILSGKGGVGKSTVGLAIGLAASARGQRVLLLEIDAPREAGGWLGTGPLAHEPRELRPGLFGANLDSREVMDEYVRQLVRIGPLARRILASPVYQRFFAAAPGLKELVLLGKLMLLEQERSGLARRPRWDLILVDAPATGHGLSLLKVPQAASAAIPVGPVGRNARRVQALLRDPKRTALAIVAIPEEMAVVEALELHAAAGAEVGVLVAGLILNRSHGRVLTREQEAEVVRLAAGSGPPGQLAPGVPARAAVEAARRHVRRRKRSRFYRDRLRRRLDVPVVTLPLLHDAAPLETAERLAKKVVRW